MGSSMMISSGLCINAAISPHLLPVPRGQLPDALVEVRVESLSQLVDVIPVDAAAQPGEEPQRLRTGHRGVEGQVAGQVAEPAVDLDGVAAGIETEQPGGAAGGADLVQEDAEDRRAHV